LIHTTPDDAIVVVLHERPRMSDEQLARMEAALQTLVSGQADLRRDVVELRTGYGEFRLDIAELRTGQDELRRDVVGLQDELRKDVGSLRDGQARIETRLDKVEVNLEEVRDDVKQIAEGHGALLVQIQKQGTEILEETGRRLDPLEAAVRKFIT
jgi:chromosome segregation ATPase